jgi:hypothetical protein
MSSLRAFHTISGLLLLTAALAVPANAEEYFKSYPVSGRPKVVVNADNGGVKVVTSDASQVQFSVTYDASDWNGGSGPTIDSQQNGTVVQLTARTGHTGWSGFGFNRMRMKVEVDMPRNADLELETSNGGVDLAALDGNIVVRSSNGGIHAQQLSGTVEIDTSNGGIQVDALKGAVKVHTSNGAIGVEHMDGRCEVATSNGAVHVGGRFDELDVHSSNGGVTVRAESGSRMASNWSLVTGNAAVHLALPADFKANLDATTSNGKIVLGLPAQVSGVVGGTQLHGALNGGGPSLSIHTTNGSIHLDPT